MLRTHAKSLALMAATALALVGVHTGAAAAATVGVGTPNPNDQLTFFKAEAPLAIEAGATATASVACPTGSVALDGSAVILSVDQGGGALSDISVTSAVRNTDGLGYTFTLVSGATGRAQAKLLVSCLSTQSSGGGKLRELAPQTDSGLVAVGAGHRASHLDCGAGAIAIAPSYTVTGSSRDYLANSAPSPSATTWDFDVVTGDGATVATSIGCLSTTLSSGAQLATIYQSEPVTVEARPAGASGAPQYSNVLPVGYSGLIAGATASAGVFPLGHEPQDRTEVFSFAGSGTATTAVIGIAITTQGQATKPRRGEPLWKLLGMPSSRQCMSPIAFSFVMPTAFQWKGQTFTIKTLVLGVDGVTYPPIRMRGPLTFTVDPGDYPGDHLTLTLTVKSTDGTTLSATRHYRACDEPPLGSL